MLLSDQTVLPPGPWRAGLRQLPVDVEYDVLGRELAVSARRDSQRLAKLVQFKPDTICTISYSSTKKVAWTGGKTKRTVVTGWPLVSVFELSAFSFSPV
jgi:hypothetical protein